MASLVGQQLKDTYDSLLKTSDNDALGGTYKEITDGAGNGSGLYLGTGGNVGIGTSSPTNYPNFTTLAIGDSVQGGVLELQYNGTQAARIAAVNPNTIALSTNNTERLRTYSTGDISFRDTSNNEAFYWDASTARLGLGTQTPSRVLHIEDSSVAAIQLENTSEADSFIDFMNPSRTFRVGYDDSTDLFKVAVTNFNDNSLVVNSSGNVGIGTTSPSRSLTVYSDVGATNILGVFDNSGTTAANCVIAFSDPASTAGQFSTRLGSVGDALAFYTNGANERMRIDSSGNVTITTGNLILDSGAGIDFSDTADATGMTSELLDDYEEGTFTPTIGGTWTANPTSLAGKYTKIGNVVHVQVTWSGGSKAGNTIGYFEGLPYAASHGTAQVMDSGVNDKGGALLANTDRVWFAQNSFSGTTRLTGTYLIN